MIIRPATLEDMPALMDMSREFVEESGYSWDWSPEVAATTWAYYLKGSNIEVYLADRDGEIAGGVVVACDRDFTLQLYGKIGYFYVREPHRRTRAGILLAEQATRWFDEMRCWDAFVSGVACLGPKQTGAFEKIMRRVGFEGRGPALVRKAHHG